MLAPATLPERYRQWNDRHGAPFGRAIAKKRILDFLRLPKSVEQLQGPFSIQPNNTTREFEYPWAFESAKLEPGMQVVELGGGLSGFQFALDQSNCHVINVDPGMEAKGRGWPCDLASIGRLNDLFGTQVELRNTTIENANLGENTVDRVFSISVIEHLTDTDIIQAMRHIHRCLKLDGLFVLTIDLFLNLNPFCSRLFNEFGQNQNIRWMTELENWELVVGNTSELFGFDAFEADAIVSNLDKYLIGRYYPATVQCLVLKKVLPKISPTTSR
jgi:ubiquinone/menaquinone biosynthesis C-methylase UbiE